MSDNTESIYIERTPPPPLTSDELAKIQDFEEESITITLSGDEALILERWFYENDEVREAFQFDDRAEELVVWQLIGRLEKRIAATFTPHYDLIVKRAWERIRKSQGE